MYTGTTLIRSVKFLKHGPSKHIGDDIDVDTSAKTDESDGSSAMLSKVPSPLIRLWSKPRRVIRLSPQDQEGWLNQPGIDLISLSIELTIV